MSRPSRAAAEALRACLACVGLLLTCGLTAAQVPPTLPQAAWGETLLLAVRVNGVAQEGMLRAVRLPEGLAIARSQG